MNIEITAAEAGMMVAFVIAIVGIGMGIRLRAMRKKKQVVKQEVEEYEFRANPETLAPEKVSKDQVKDQEKPPHDVDALLDDLKKDSD